MNLIRYLLHELGPFHFRISKADVPLLYLRMILVVVGLVIAVLLAQSSMPAMAAAKPMPSTQLITHEFPTQFIPTDYTTYATLLEIPFTTTGPAKVQITNLMSYIAHQAAFGIGATLTCRLELDQTPIVSKTYSTTAGGVELEASMTSTQTVGAGAHTIALACTSYLDEFPIEVRSHGTSLIIIQ